jgi:hypothetical protein
MSVSGINRSSSRAPIDLEMGVTPPPPLASSCTATSSPNTGPSGVRTNAAEPAPRGVLNRLQDASAAVGHSLESSVSTAGPIAKGVVVYGGAAIVGAAAVGSTMALLAGASDGLSGVIGGAIFANASGLSIDSFCKKGGNLPGITSLAVGVGGIAISVANQVLSSSENKSKITLSTLAGSFISGAVGATAYKKPVAQLCQAIAAGALDKVSIAAATAKMGAVGGLIQGGVLGGVVGLIAAPIVVAMSRTA